MGQKVDGNLFGRAERVVFNLIHVLPEAAQNVGKASSRALPFMLVLAFMAMVVDAEVSVGTLLF